MVDFPYCILGDAAAETSILDRYNVDDGSIGRGILKEEIGYGHHDGTCQ